MEDSSESSFQDRLIAFAKKNLIVLVLFFGGLIFLGIGLMQIMGARSASVKFEKGSEVLGSESLGGKGGLGGSGKKIKVDVEGQVLKPGVYSLNADSRVQDALIAAGGLTSDANRNAINLAAKLIDGQKIYVPAVGETANVSNLGGSGGSGGSVQSNSNELISVNSGTQAELESLPAIGPVTAEKIINGRPYGTLEELVSKKVVGQKTFEKIISLISL